MLIIEILWKFSLIHWLTQILAFYSRYCPLAKPYNQKSQGGISGKQGGNVVGIWWLITRPFVKYCLSNCFTWLKVNMKRCTLLPENDVLKVSLLLKIWDYKVLQHIKILLPYDGTGLGTSCSSLQKKKCGPMINLAVKLHHTVTFLGFKGSWIACRFLLVQIWQLWYLTYLLRQKWASSFHRIIHDRVTSSSIRARNSSAKVLQISESPDCFVLATKSSWMCATLYSN